MTHNEILAKIKNILYAYIPEGSQEKLTETTDIVNDLGINSARIVDIVLDLENKFGIRIDDSEIVKMNSVGDAVTLVESLLPERQEKVLLQDGAD